MTWTSTAESVWQVRPWIAWALLALYLVPILRLASYPLSAGGRFLMRINGLFGRWEHLIQPLRDTLVFIWLAGGGIWYFWLGIEKADRRFFILSFIAALLLLAGWGMRRFSRSAKIKLLDFARLYPAIHPQEFFDHLFCSSGAIRHSLPKSPFREIDPSSIDFRKGKPSARDIGPANFIAGVLSTIWLSRLVLLAKATGDAAFLQSSASALAVIWGTRIGQLAHASVTVEKAERLPRRGDPAIYLFTHMSFLDFAFVPLALAAGIPRNELAGGGCLPSFLLAKDHFRNNILFYRILGIGKAAEAMGMIFVDRRANKGPEGAKAVTAAAAKDMLSGQPSLAIFPQGARAAGYRGAKGERLDGAYYTVGSRERVSQEGKHLKKGAAHIAAAAALEISRAGSKARLRIAPIAISGTALACPRGSMRILANIHIRLLAGEAIVVDEDAAASADHLHARIDSALKTAGRVHAELERRFFEDMRRFLDPMKIDEIAIAMKPWRGEDYLVHAILDAIYACPPRRRRPFLGELTHALQNFGTREELLALKVRVAKEVIL